MCAVRQSGMQMDVRATGWRLYRVFCAYLSADVLSAVVMTRSGLRCVPCCEVWSCQVLSRRFVPNFGMFTGASFCLYFAVDLIIPPGRYGLVCLELWAETGHCLWLACVARFEPLFADRVVLPRVLLLHV